jgi:hypothetical protein
MMPPPRLVSLTFLMWLLLGCSSSQNQTAQDAGPTGDAAQRDSFVDSGGPDGEAAMRDVAFPPADGLPPETGPLPPDPCIEAGTCPPGVWANVTPSDMSGAVLRPTKNAFGPGSIVGDPARPSDMYVGGSAAGLWKSSDYGNRWTLINSTLPDVPRGVVIAVAGTSPPTIWWAGFNVIYKSVDGGATFKMTTVNQSLYSLKVDPNDSNHLVSGLHEADGIVESTDGGGTWRLVGGAGFPSGGKSWYPYFVDTGNAATTRTTWFAIAQNGASAVMTSDSGTHWSIPNGLTGLQHPHGNSQIYQRGSTLFVAGDNGMGGHGVYRSTDLGMNWSRVDSGQASEAVVWGTPANVYAMYAWACSGCNLGTQFESAAQPGIVWSKASVPSDLVIGPNSVVVANDGAHFVFVAVMWDEGIWRYVEP